MEAGPHRGNHLMLKRIATAAAVLLLLTSAQAMAVGKGTSTFSIQLGNGTADLAAPSGAGYITSFAVSEIEPKIEWSHQMKDDYALNIGFGIGMFSETNKPGTAASPGSPDLETKVKSFFVRIGGDRVVKVGDRAVLYFGPGFEYWSGKYEYDGGSFTENSESATRISLSGRIGGTMLLTESVGFTCNVGRKLGTASMKWDGAEATWNPSSTDASGGITFIFGGN